METKFFKSLLRRCALLRVERPRLQPAHLEPVQPLADGALIDTHAEAPVNGCAQILAPPTHDLFLLRIGVRQHPVMEFRHLLLLQQRSRTRGGADFNSSTPASL